VIRKHTAWGISTRMPISLCPSCGKTQDAAGHEGGATPRPGDIALCNGCLAASLYDEGLRLRLPTAAEQAEIDAAPEVAAGRRRLVEIGLVSPALEALCERLERGFEDAGEFTVIVDKADLRDAIARLRRNPTPTETETAAPLMHWECPVCELPRRCSPQRQPEHIRSGAPTPPSGDWAGTAQAMRYRVRRDGRNVREG
jgi:hypothetical protein